MLKIVSERANVLSYSCVSADCYYSSWSSDYDTLKFDLLLIA